jgi:predicted restriction endonuclease
MVPPADELPFFLTATEDEIRALRKVRRGQQRFKFEVEQRYGSACALCGLAVRGLVEAAHLCAKADEGSNDPRNGLPLCVLHHRALDRGLWAIEPTTLMVRTLEGGSSLQQLRISNESIKGLSALPHPAALEYVWNDWLRSVSQMTQ